MTAPAISKCIFCGVLGVWWDCNCKGATEAKTGKRPKPKIIRIDGRMVIVVDEETVEANHFGLERYRSRVTPSEAE